MKEVPKILQDHRFRFIPLRQKDKIPIEKSWQEKAQYRFDEPSLLVHLENKGNIGIVCCKGQPLVIDFDEEEIEKKIAPLLPKTFTVRSGRGRLHKYYICSNAENMKILDKDKKTLCDIQADRKQVVIPPSIHPNGNEYYVVDESEIANIDMSEIKALFYNYIPKDKITFTTRTDSSTQFIKNAVSFERLLKDFGIDVGGNPTMCPLGHASQGKKCFSFDDNKQVAYCFHCEWGGDVISLVQEIEKIDFPQTLKWFGKKYNIQIPKTENVNEPISSDDLTIKQLAWNTYQEIIKKHHFISYGDKERSIIYVYKNGFYSDNGKKFIHQLTQQMLLEKATTNIKREIIEHVYSATLVYELPENIPELICTNNGILNIETREFIPHDPEIKFFSKIPIDYNPTAVCPQIEKFLKEVVSAEHLITIKKWIGYTLLREYRYACLLMLNGSGANGKSTFLSLIKRFVGISNVCSISMHEMETDMFAISLLKDKMLNIFADLPSTDLKSTSMMKGLTGGDNFSANQKFKDRVGFVNYAKFMYSCNQLPGLPEDTMAIWRRLLLVEFPNTFTIAQQDTGLLEKMTTCDELSGLLNYALDGFKQLLIDNGFGFEIEKTREAYIRKTDFVGSFVLDCIVKEPVDTTKDQLYAAYVEYCEIKMYDVCERNMFFRLFPTKVTCFQTCPEIDGKRTYCLRGVKILMHGMRAQNLTIGVFSSYSPPPPISSLDVGQKKATHTMFEGANSYTVDVKNILSIIEFLKVELKHIPSFMDIQEYTSIDETRLDEILSVLKKDGKIYEPKPNNYDVVN